MNILGVYVLTCFLYIFFYLEMIHIAQQENKWYQYIGIAIARSLVWPIFFLYELIILIKGLINE
jgi:hypothetical protein